MSYTVKLTVFEGPLDLLLQLIEKQELEITTISLAAVTDQYLDYIGLLEDRDPDALVEFLVIAAKLLYIKSQALLPKPPVPEEEGEDVGADLTRQLMEYKLVKELAQELRSREGAGQRMYQRIAPPPKITGPLRLEGVTLEDLVAAFRRAMNRLPAATASPGVPPIVYTVAEKIASICGLLAQGRMNFTALLMRSRDRLEVIVTFLALLELMKQRRVVVQQDRLFGDIYVEGQEPAGADPDTGGGSTRVGADPGPADEDMGPAEGITNGEE